MRVALTLLTLSLATIGCRRSMSVTTSTAATAPDTLVAGTVIRSAGTWSTHTSKDSHRLEVTVSGTALSWRLIYEEKLPGGGTTGGNTSSGTTLSSPSDPWFIFVESPRRFWFFNGRGELEFNLSDHTSSRTGPVIFDGKLHSTQEKVPAGLIAHLPPELQKLLPPVTQERRPAF